MRFAVLTFCLLTLLVIAPGVGRSADSRAIVAKTDVQVRKTQGCQREADRDRSPTPTRRLYSRSTSMPFRNWAFRLWHRRAVDACGKVRWLNALPPRAIVYVFKRVGQQAQAIHVASGEAGSGNIWAHPYCTRTDNGVGFLGCFQFGSWARSTYGFGPTALDQAWAAYWYVADAGGWCSGWTATAWGC